MTTNISLDAKGDLTFTLKMTEVEFLALQMALRGTPREQFTAPELKALETIMPIIEKIKVAK